MIIVITGASSGIGETTALMLAKKGHKVYSLSRRVKDHKEVTYITCDITDSIQINRAIAQVIDEMGRIDVLINNAGMGISGPSEFDNEKDFKHLFEVNFFGLVSMTQTCLPFLRESSGKIINIGSVAGDFPIPFQSMYSASKAAVEAYSNALQNELRPFDIRVTTVLPGDTKTGFTSSRIKNIQGSIYGGRVGRSVSKMEKDEIRGVSSKKVTKVICKCVSRKNPPLKITVGIGYKTLVFLKRFLPTKLVNYILYRMYGK